MKDFPQNRKPGFSLIELLVVVAILSVLMMMVVPAVSSFSESNNLTNGGQVVLDQIRLGRQIASSQNRSVEIRLITNTEGKGYSAIQVWQQTLQSSGMTNAWEPAAKLIRLPQNTVIAPDQQVLSPILSASYSTQGSMTVGGSNMSYSALQIRASGMMAVDGLTTSPPTIMQQAYLTVVPQRLAEQAAFPPNYVTIQIDPISGNPLVFRP